MKKYIIVIIIAILAIGAGIIGVFSSKKKSQPIQETTVLITTAADLIEEESTSIEALEEETIIAITAILEEETTIIETEEEINNDIYYEEEISDEEIGSIDDYVPDNYVDNSDTDVIWDTSSDSIDSEVLYDDTTDDGWIYINEPNQWNSTYMGVHKITNTSSLQWQWLQTHDWYENDEGIISYDGRILVALTPAFGTIGDYVDLLMEDGNILYCIIGDVKWDADTYGHWGTGGLNVLEIIVAEWWYNGHENKWYPNVIAYR